MVINSNLAAQTSARLLSESSSMLSKSLARLSSGSKLVSAEDDVAGAAVSLRFDAQISGINATQSNVGNAISFAQTQDGILKKVTKAFDRMSELAVLAQDATKTGADLALYNQEFTTLGQYIDDVAAKEFNGIALFAGTDLDVTTDETGSTFTMQGIDLADAVYTTATAATVATAGDAITALDNVRDAITRIGNDRATVGANLARLTMTNEQLSVLKDNISASNSRIKDVDVAEESAAFARANILVQAGTAMLAQANATPQTALRLLL